ncbi:MAG TPA: hypothetical protein VFU65_04745 [Actinocrinis sp.]|nr:hypothetical protein [Actinocrinis sp.]
MRRALRMEQVLAVGGVAVTLVAVSACSSAGGEISDVQYRAVSVGAAENSLRSEFGGPLALADVPQILPTPPGDECLYYQDNVPTIDGTIYRFCFRNGVLDLKDGYGPLFESGTVRPARS